MEKVAFIIIKKNSYIIAIIKMEEELDKLYHLKKRELIEKMI